MAGSGFPFRHYRTGQREAIERAREAFGRGKRFVVVEAPTGAGKSAIAVTLAREASSAYILTAQKILQDQYLRDFPELAVMKGRANYPCLVAPTHAAAAPCIVGRRFPECDDCPYFTAKGGAIAASGTIMNYSYFLAELNHAGGFSNRDLLVLDEAHNAEETLMNFVQITLTDRTLGEVGIAERVPTSFDNEEYFEFAEDLISRFVNRSLEVDAELKKDVHKADLALALMQTKQWLEQQIQRLELLHYSREDMRDEWVVERWRDRDGQGIRFKPVRIAGLAGDLLFGFTERVLMLSATILDPATFLRSLGVVSEQAEVIQVESDFPPENRPLYPRPVGKLTRHYLDASLPRLVAEIADLFESHPCDKGVIHAHSYRIASYIARNLPPRLASRLIAHYSPTGREAALERHLLSSEPTVLLTPSMTEGIDLVDDLARWQVICKIPYPYLGDPQVARRKEIDPAWYAWRTCLTIVQAYGRSVRGPDDFAVTYVMDGDFELFVRRQERRLPEWFLAALQPSP